MNISPILSLTMVLVLTSVIVSGVSDNVDVGPFSVGFSINASIVPVINAERPMNLSGFSEYNLQILTASASPKSINVTIDYYENNTDVSESRLMSLITDMVQSNSYKLNWKKVSIGNIPGIMAQVQDIGSFSAYSMTAYSPDGDGKRGRIIVIIKSFLPEDVTGSFLRDLKVQRKIGSS